MNGSQNGSQRAGEGTVSGYVALAVAGLAGLAFAVFVLAVLGSMLYVAVYALTAG